MNKRLTIWFRITATFLLTALLLTNGVSRAIHKDSDDQKSDTPIKHVVVIFQENVSFDHYFASYPVAENPAGEPSFHAKASTPTVNGLNNPLLVSNPNLATPFRFNRSHAAICDQNHDYKPEQQAYDAGLVDKFVEFTGNVGPADGSIICTASDTMGYFDGNTVTALWNYAQRFAISDNSFNT